MKKFFLKSYSITTIFILLALITFGQVVVVTPASVGSSWFTADTKSGGSVSFIPGFATPPMGCGSLQLTSTDAGGSSNAKAQLINYSYVGTSLSTFNNLKYSTYRSSVSTNPLVQTIAFQMEVDYLGDGVSYTTLVFEPVYQAGGVGAMLLDTWQQWDAFNGGNAIWWSTRAIPGVCANSCFVTWSSILAANPGAKIQGGVGFNIGSGWAGQYTGAVDQLIINTATYNFEQVPNNVINTNTGRTYCTIQSAINDPLTLNGHTLHAGAGTYTENVTVNKELTIYGDGQGSTIIIPAISNPNCGGLGGGTLCGGGSNVILVQANNVTIRNLTVDGDNPLLTSSVNVGGANIDARNGIITNHAVGVYNNLNVNHVTVKNIFRRGIYASSGGTFAFDNNTVDNVQAEGASIGMFNFGGSGSFTNNTVSNTNDAISSNWSLGTIYTGNTVTNSGSGIHTDNNGYNLTTGTVTGTPDLIQNNTVINSTTGGYGTWVFAPFVAPTVNANTITNVDVALANAGQNASVTPIFSNNTVDGQSKVGSTGVYQTTDEFGNGTNNVSGLYTNNYITNSETGFFLEYESGNTNTITSNNNSITGNLNYVSNGVGVMAAGTLVNNFNCNWWGTTHAAVIGSHVGSGTNYIPFLTSGADGSGSAGFQPSGSCNGPQSTISFTATTTNGSTGSTTNGTPSAIIINFCQGDFFTFSNYSSDPGANVGALEKLYSSGNVTAGGGAVPSDRPQTDISPAGIAGFFSGTYGPYGLSGGTTGTIDQTYTPYYDLDHSGSYTAGDLLGTPVTLHYNINNALVIVCPGDKNVSTDPNVCNAIVNYAVNVTGNATTVSYSFSGATIATGIGTGSGSTFNKGSTTVTVNATNSCGTVSCHFVVIVRDNQKPTIICPPNKTVNPMSLSGATISNIGTPVTSDNCPGQTYSNNHPSANYPIGNTTVTWTVTDASGNSASCAQIITVRDPYCDKTPNNEKVYVCHNGHTICISVNALQTHLSHGDNLGQCSWYSNPITLAPLQVSDERRDVTNAKNDNIIPAEKLQQLLPVEYKVSNYPNPFNTSTMIRYDVPVDSKISLKIYNAMGLNIATLYEGARKAGSYTISYNALNLAAGIYSCHFFASVNNEHRTKSIKLIITK